jgi:hypothetical protein
MRSGIDDFDKFVHQLNYNILVDPSLSESAELLEEVVLAIILTITRRHSQDKGNRVPLQLDGVQQGGGNRARSDFLRELEKNRLCR